MTAYTTLFNTPPSIGNFLVGDTMACPATAPIYIWTYCGNGVWVPTPVVIKRFPTWPSGTGIFLAALVASSTASRTSNVVTISATSHGITTGSTYVGFRFFYPGSPSLAAGFYDSIQTVADANTLTFSAPGPDFVSESINSGTAYTTATELINMTIPGSTLRDQSKCSLSLLRGGDGGASNKTVALTFGGSTLSSNSYTTSSQMDSKLSFRCEGLAKQVAMATVPDGVVSSNAMVVTTKDITSDQILSIRGTATAASTFLAIWGAHLEITV